MFKLDHEHVDWSLQFKVELYCLQICKSLSLFVLESLPFPQQRQRQLPLLLKLPGLLYKEINVGMIFNAIACLRKAFVVQLVESHKMFLRVVRYTQV
jgi:hypothetical protein